MPEPIRPEDSNIPIPSWEDMPLEVISSGDGLGRDDWYGPMAHKLALTEAIHQTFERDADWSADQERYDLQRYEWDVATGNSREEFFELDGATLEAPAPPNRRRHDPNTEIDRLARLIVDGEYRRRLSTEKETSNA